MFLYVYLDQIIARKMGHIEKTPQSVHTSVPIALWQLNWFHLRLFGSYEIGFCPQRPRVITEKLNFLENVKHI